MQPLLLVQVRKRAPDQEPAFWNECKNDLKALKCCYRRIIIFRAPPYKLFIFAITAPYSTHNALLLTYLVNI